MVVCYLRFDKRKTLTGWLSTSGRGGRNATQVFRGPLLSRRLALQFMFVFRMLVKRDQSKVPLGGVIEPTSHQVLSFIHTLVERPHDGGVFR
jgi:hypothetical protein